MNCFASPLSFRPPPQTERDHNSSLNRHRNHVQKSFNYDITFICWNPLSYAVSQSLPSIHPPRGYHPGGNEVTWGAMMTWERERGEGGQSRFLYHSPRQTQKRVDLYYSHAPHEEGNNYKSVEQKLTRSKIWCDLHNGGELTVKGSNMRINTFIC